MRGIYRALAGLIAIGVVLQAAFIAFAWFSVLNDVEGGAIFDENTEYNAGQSLHAIVGSIAIPTLCLALLIVSFFANIPGGVRWAAAVFVVAALQIALAMFSFDAPVIGVLHGLNAFALAGIAGRAARQASVEPATAAAATAS